ncbi:MAG TPA: hypothetical protein VE058_01015 [Steroidobacteraceae bacterium]|nr:hypothetical protein [Steroidobacteraceae bacterium]
MRFEEIELAPPIVPYHENIDLIGEDVVHFLIPVILWNYLVNMSYCAEYREPLSVAEDAILSLPQIKLIGRESHHKIIAQRSCALEQTYMADME